MTCLYDNTWRSRSSWKPAETLFALSGCVLDLMTLKKSPSHAARMWPPCRIMYWSVVTKLWGGEKFTKHQPSDKSQQTDLASQLLSLLRARFLSQSLSHNRKARHLRRAWYGTSPGDRYVTPPKTLWHNYTSVALKGKGRGAEGRVGEWEGGVLGTERERVSEWEEKWRVCGVGGAAGCFTPGLFKETAQGMPLALLTKHFSFFFFCLFVFFLSIAGCAPVKSSGPQSSPTAIWGCLRNFFSQTLGLFQCWCFKWIIHHCCGQAEGYLGGEDRWWFNVTLRAKGVSPNLLQQAAHWQSISVAFRKFCEILDQLFFSSNLATS